MSFESENVVPESQVNPLLAALKRLIDHTPVGNASPDLTAVREQAEQAHREYVLRPHLQPYVIQYHHRHGVDVHVMLSLDEPDGEAFHEGVFEPDRDDEYIEVGRVDILVAHDGPEAAHAMEAVTGQPGPGRER